MTQDPFEAARSLFPSAMEAPYLNVASRGILSAPAAEAAHAMLMEHVGGRARKEDWSPLGERVRGRFAELIRATPEEIAFTKNTAEGLNIVASALPWRPGDNVVLSVGLEHPNNIYPWLNLRRHGVDVRIVDPVQDSIDADAMIAAMDERTRVVSLSLVSFTPGFRAPLRRIAKACQDNQILLLVDAVQACGALRVDVEELGIDALATATTKGLLGPYGCGFLFVRRRWIEKLEPAYLARFSVDQNGGHESEMGSLDYRLRSDAKRFEVGHYNWPGLAAVDVSLGQILAIGAPAIEAHALRLADLLRAGLQDLGFPVCQPATPEARTHIVALGEIGGGAYETEDPHLNALAQHLEAHGVRFSVRRGLIRLATHLYNNDEDVARVLTLASSRRRTAPAGVTRQAGNA